MSRLLAPAVLVLATLFATTTRAGEPGQKTIVIVRHAEAEPETAGPQRLLTQRGSERALELARLLGETPLTAVYATQYARTKLTAEPIARLAGRPVVAIDDTARTIAALAAAPWGSTVVVVGHSNTVPLLVAGVTGQPFPADVQVTHDRIWVITVARDGTSSTVRLRYGLPEQQPAVAH